MWSYLWLWESYKKWSGLLPEETDDEGYVNDGGTSLREGRDGGVVHYKVAHVVFTSQKFQEGMVVTYQDRESRDSPVVAVVVKMNPDTRTVDLLTSNNSILQEVSIN